MPLGIIFTIVIVFMVLAHVLEVTGSDKAFTDVGISLFGRVAGGPAKASVIASGLFGSISGGAAANVAVTGVVTIPMMKRIGYTPEYAAAVEAVASNGGHIMPPVMAATVFIMAQLINVPYIQIVYHAFLPAFLYYFAVFIMVHVDTHWHSQWHFTVQASLDLNAGCILMENLNIIHTSYLSGHSGTDIHPRASTWNSALRVIRRREPAVKADSRGAGSGYPGFEGTTFKKLLKPRAKRLAVSHTKESLGLSERKACLLVNISTSVYRYQPKEDNDAALRQRLRELAGQRKRFGSPRLHIMLKREGLVINHKRIERIYREEGLSLRRKRRRKGAAGTRLIMPSPQNQTSAGPWISSLTVSSPGGVFGLWL